MNSKYLLDRNIWERFINKLEHIAQVHGNSSTLRGRLIGAVRESIISNAELRTAQDSRNAALKGQVFYKGRWYVPVTPTEPLMASHLISDVVRRGDFFAVDVETLQLTIIKMGGCCGHCH